MHAAHARWWALGACCALLVASLGATLLQGDGPVSGRRDGKRTVSFSEDVVVAYYWHSSHAVVPAPSLLALKAT